MQLTESDDILLDRARSGADRLCHEVDEFLDSTDQHGLEIVPVAHPGPDVPPRRGDVRLVSVRQAERTTGAALPLHVPRHVRPPGRHLHAVEDHVWYVQAGHGRFWVGDEVVEAGPGSILHGPHGIPHAFSADSDELRVLVVTMPAGLEAFFEAVGVPAEGDGPPPPGWVSPAGDDEAALAQRHGIELLGPQPGWEPRPPG